jgi:hypothetical protein
MLDLNCTTNSTAKGMLGLKYGCGYSSATNALLGDHSAFGLTQLWHFVRQSKDLAPECRKRFHAMRTTGFFMTISTEWRVTEISAS